MGKRIFWVAIVLAAVLCGYYYYRHHQDEVRLANGDVTCIGCMSPQERAKFQQESAASAGDGSGDVKRQTASAADTTNSGAAGGGDATASGVATGTGTGQSAPTSTATPNAAVVPGAALNGAGSVMAAITAATEATAALPATDTIAPNPPNGAVFSGKGTYQWYRQGNLTWRVDTTSGRSCIIYATMSEWRKQVVYSHGCGRSA